MIKPCLLTIWWTNIALENGHRNSGFSHKIWWFSIAMLVHQRVTLKLPKVQLCCSWFGWYNQHLLSASSVLFRKSTFCCTKKRWIQSNTCYVANVWMAPIYIYTYTYIYIYVYVYNILQCIWIYGSGGFFACQDATGEANETDQQDQHAKPMFLAGKHIGGDNSLGYHLVISRSYWKWP